jgi:hypothetical protein
MNVRYENGESLPPLDCLIALADIYGLTPAALLVRHAATLPIIAAIDQAEASTIARLGVLLGDPDSA